MAPRELRVQRHIATSSAHDVPAASLETIEIRVELLVGHWALPGDGA